MDDLRRAHDGGRPGAPPWVGGGHGARARDARGGPPSRSDLRCIHATPQVRPNDQAAPRIEAGEVPPVQGGEALSGAQEGLDVTAERSPFRSSPPGRPAGRERVYAPSAMAARSPW